MRLLPRLALLACLVAVPAAARAAPDCTLLADAATGRVLHEEGACDRRLTPASTFKIAIALMGYDAGILLDEHSPTLPFRPGYPDWRPEWRADIDPTSWIRYSVVWYSQQVTQRLGMARFQRYAEAFGYGNADVSGDPKKHDGLTHAWLGSSLAISPREQAAFLERLVQRALPVSAHAYAMTEAITRLPDTPNGWEVHGKTGAAPLRAAGPGHAVGWFVGWARKGGRAVVFVRQVEDETKQPVSPGLREREAFLQALPGLLDRL